MFTSATCTTQLNMRQCVTPFLCCQVCGCFCGVLHLCVHFLFPPLLPLLRSLKITRHPDATTACVCVCMYIPLYVCARVCALNSVEDEKERDKMMPKASKSSSTPKIPVGLFAGVCLCVFVCACGNIHIF